MVGGTGSGKTWYAPRWIYKKLMERPGIRCLAIGLGYERHVDHVMMYETTKFLNEIGLRGKYDLNKKGGLLTLANDSQIIFGSAENPLTMEGAHLELCWIDEAGMMSRLAWDVAQRRTGGCYGPILITTIPYFEGWLKSDVYMPSLHGDDDIEWIQCATKDNPAYSVREIERMRRTLRPEKFAIYYEGKFAKASGLIFPHPDDIAPTLGPNGEDMTPLIVEPFEIPEDWPQFSGHDWGFNNAAAALWGRLSPDDVLYIVGEYEATQRTVDDHVGAWSRMGVLDTDEAWGDPAAPEMNQRATDMGYPIGKANNSVQAGIDAVYERLVTNRLKVFRGCKKWIDHRATYRWATSSVDEEVLLDKPLKPQPAEHLMDATRYLCMGLAEFGTVATVETAVLGTRRQVRAA